MRTVREIEARIGHLENVMIPFAEKTIDIELTEPSKWAKEIVRSQERIIKEANAELMLLYKEMDDFKFDSLSKHEQEEFTVAAVKIDDSLPFL